MIFVFVDSKKRDILTRLNKRKGFDRKIFKKLKEIQLPLDHKKESLILLLKTIIQKSI